MPSKPEKAISSLCNVIKKWQLTSGGQVPQLFEDQENFPKELLIELLESQIKTPV